ncbi:MAG TPA: Hsp20/alpha crystallin family protein [Opitutales bacterium]|jgi:HSP20 family protein|nr:Hsp20/alpha crystallin family protein [Opitutales bacterium]
MHKISSTLHFAKRRLSMTRDHETHWAPNTDVYVADTGIVIKVELAGMQRENLELTVEGNSLRVSGQRPDGCRSGHCKFLVMEIDYGAFETVIEVPEGFDVSRGKAVYQNGFLRVDIPYLAANSPGSVADGDD